MTVQVYKLDFCWMLVCLGWYLQACANSGYANAWLSHLQDFVQVQRLLTVVTCSNVEICFQNCRTWYIQTNIHQATHRQMYWVCVRVDNAPVQPPGTVKCYVRRERSCSGGWYKNKYAASWAHPPISQTHICVWILTAFIVFGINDFERQWKYLVQI